MRSLTALFVFLLACDDPAQAPASASAPSTATATASAATATSSGGPVASAKATARASASAKQPSSKERATVLAHLGAGRKLAKDKKWKDALVELDKALAIQPKDGRVLSEIGWAAFNAGDLDRAKKANKQALVETKAPGQRAAVLYNVGRVAEQEKDNAAAKTAYGESLSLRNNAEVEKRFLAVGGSADEIVRPFEMCKAGADSIADLCKCLVKESGDILYASAEYPAKCEASKSSPDLGDPSLSIVELSIEFPRTRIPILVAKDGAKFRAVASLGEDYEPGAFGVHNETRIHGGKARTVKGRKVVVISHEQDNLDLNMAGLEACQHNEKLETFCVLGDGKSPTKCTWTLPIEITSGCGPGVEVDPADLDPETAAFVKELKASGPPDKMKASNTLDDGGKLVTKLESGEATLLPKYALGERQLVNP